MSPRHACALAALFLAACTSPAERLDQAWTAYGRRSNASLERAETILPRYTALLRAQGDEEELARVALPPGNPVALIASITSNASLAYLNADRPGLERACAALARVERDLDAMESRVAR